MSKKQLITSSRNNKLKKLEQENGLEYAIVRNHEIQVGHMARDYLKKFATYIGCDGKASKSAIKKDKDGNPVFSESGGAVHVAVARQIKQILGYGANDADALGDPEIISKRALAWAKIKPTLEAGAQRQMPRKKCFEQLWDKFKEIAAI